MLNDVAAATVYLACGATDMRKSIDTLAALVKERFSLDPFSLSLYVFCNRRKDKLKILKWDHNGFWLYYRRLEKGRFRWPEKTDSSKIAAVDYRQLRWLLDGLELRQPKAHSVVTARTIV